jgi:hypothetical protein
MAFQTEKELVRQGEILFKEEKFTEAYPFYSQLVIRSPQDPQYNYHLGVCTIFSVANKEEAIPFLENVVSNSGIENEVHYYLGKAYLLSYRFEEAANEFKKYKKNAPAKNMEKYQVDRQIEMCNNGRKLVRNISDWVVADKKELSSKDFFLAYDLSTIGGKLLIKPNEEKFKTAFDLKKKEESIIFLSRDNKQIFFSSYGTDGTHGKDIYHISKLPNNTWSKAQILPNTINTDSDEDFPFFHPNGKVLYFSSKGLSSMGGYDIFKCSYDAEKNSWGKPENLGFPINSPDDDILYMTDSLEKEAYFSSSRSTPPNKISVYKLNIEKIPAEWAIIKGIIVPNRDKQNLAATITVKNYQDKSQIGIFNSNPYTGKYFLVLPNGVNCVFTVECAGFTTQSQIINIPLRIEMNAAKQELSYDLKNDKLIIRTNTDNFNEEEYDQLVPSVIKKKAMLDMAGAGKANEGSNGNFNDNSIVGIAYNDARELDEEAMEAAKQAEVATNLATTKNDLALQKAKEAQTMNQEALQFNGNVEQKKILQEKANNALNEAEELKQEAAVAYKLAKKMEITAANKRKEADLSLQYAKALENASNSKNSQESMEKVAEIEKQLDNLNKNNPDTISIFDSYKMGMESKQKELNKILTKVNEIKQEISDNEVLIVKSQGEADKTRNKSLKEGLQNEIEGLKQDNDDRQNELKKYQPKLKKLQDEYNVLAKESAMAGDVVTIAKKGGLPSTAVIPKKIVDAPKPLPPPTPAQKKEVEEFNYDQLLAELNELNAAKVDAANEIKDEIEQETTKAKAYTLWSEALTTLADEQKLNLSKEKDQQNKIQLSKLIIHATQLAKEKKRLATEATAKASRLKAAKALLAKNAQTSKSVTSADFKVDYSKLLDELNLRNTEKITVAEREETEIKRETTKAELFYKWADELTKYAAEIKTKTLTEADKNKNSEIGSNIIKAKKLAVEKRALGDQCNARVIKLRQLANVKIVEVKPVIKQDTVIAINTLNLTDELAAAEKIKDFVDRERTKEGIYKKLAKNADENIVKLRFAYNKENNSNKSANIAKQIRSQEIISRENKILAKKSLAAIESYLARSRQAAKKVEEVVIAKPKPPVKVEKPVVEKPIQPVAIVPAPAKLVVSTPPIVAAKKENIAKYDIYDRYTRVKLDIKLAKNEKFEVKPEPVYSDKKPIPTTGVSKNGLIYTVQVGAFLNPIAQGTFGGINPIVAEPTPTGYMRYFAGQFNKFFTADQVKTQIRNIGFRDAFVVAYYNGRRITLTEALRIENGGAPSPELANVKATSPFGFGVDSRDENNSNSSKNINNSATTETITGKTNSTNSKIFNSNNKNRTTDNGEQNNTTANNDNTNTLDTEENDVNKTTAIDTAISVDDTNNSNQIAAETNSVTGNDITNSNGEANNTITNDTKNNTAGKTTVNNNSSGNNKTNSQVTNTTSQNATNNGQTTNSAAIAGNVSDLTGLFYTVQVGLYSQPVSSDVFFNMNPLFNETTDAGKMRYTIGIYNNIARAIEAKEIAVNAGISNAFITAFYNSKRITLAEARQLEANGEIAFTNSPVLNILPYASANNQLAVVTPSIITNNSTVSNSSVNTATKQPNVTSVYNQNKNQSASTATSAAKANNLLDEVVFKVQIGAYREEVPTEKANIFAKLSDKNLSNYINDNGLTIYTVGNFNTYGEAATFKLELVEQYGLTDGFVVAFKNGKRIPLSEVKIK